MSGMHANDYLGSAQTLSKVGSFLYPEETILLHIAAVISQQRAFMPWELNWSSSITIAAAYLCEDADSFDTIANNGRFRYLCIVASEVFMASLIKFTILNCHGKITCSCGTGAKL